MNIYQNNGTEISIGISDINYITYATDTSILVLGQTIQGGKIFYIDSTGHNGLIVDRSIKCCGAPWYGGDVSHYIPLDGTTTAVDSGATNTAKILTAQGPPPVYSNDGYAAFICANLSDSGFTDWYLPSRDELNQIYLNINLITGANNLAQGAVFWSSSEYDDTTAWSQSLFGNGSQNIISQSNYANFIAIRTFSKNILTISLVNGEQIRVGITNIDSITYTTDTTILTLGESYQGGQIFYIDSTGQHGLIVGGPAFTGPWSDVYSTTWATDSTIGSGASNTSKIINSIGYAEGNVTPGAAPSCAGIQAAGYTDWYLPSIDELNKLYLNQALVSMSFSTSYYWSSTEYNTDNALRLLFSSGSQQYYQKEFPGSFVCIRIF